MTDLTLQRDTARPSAGPSRRPDFRIGALLERRSALHPDRLALVFGERSWTYGELWRWIERTAARLRHHGAGPGSVVAFTGASRPEVFVIMYAAARLGAVFLPINGAATPPEISYLVGDAAVDVLVADEGSRAKLSAAGCLPSGPSRISLDGPAGDGWSTLGDASPAETDALPAAVAAGEDDIALIAYTSGTSGRPKGVILTHGNVFWSCVNGLLSLDLAGDDVTLIATPLFHIAVLSGLGSYTWAKGGKVVLAPSFSPGGFLDAVRRHRVTLTFAVPTMLDLIARDPAFPTADLASLRWILCGGAAAPLDTAAAFEGRGIPVIASYGLTETGAGVTYRDPREVADRSGEAGLAAPLAEIRVVDSANRPVPPGSAGEIVVRTPSLMTGYLNRPEETAAVFDAEGWFHGGDRGHLDDQGRLVVVGRIKDTIVTGGENVDPSEVEAQLRKLPSVADVAVVGTPDPTWGEIVTALVVPAQGTEPSLKEIQEFLAATLTRHKIPRRLELREGLPRTATGKLQRHRLREHPDGR